MLSWPWIYFYVIIAAANLPTLLETEAAAVANSNLSVKLSCFACNTMNYLNETNNKCRFLQPKPGDSNQKATGISKSDRSLQTRDALEPFPEYLSPLNDDSSATAQSSPNSDPSSGLELMRKSGHVHFVTSNRTLYSNDHIETRQCANEEHYCVVRSVWRYEFVGDEIQSKFWMLERNCSKTCYNDCMLIGDRNRLRVCNSCCKNSDCNLGSGAVSWRNKLANLLMMTSFSLMCLTSHHMQVLVPWR